MAGTTGAVVCHSRSHLTPPHLSLSPLLWHHPPSFLSRGIVPLLPSEYVGSIHIFLGPYRGNPIALYLRRDGDKVAIAPKVYPFNSVVGQAETPNKAAADFEEKWKAKGLVTADMYDGPSWEGGIKPERPAPPKPTAPPKPAGAEGAASGAPAAPKPASAAGGATASAPKPTGAPPATGAAPASKPASAAAAPAAPAAQQAVPAAVPTPPPATPQAQTAPASSAQAPESPGGQSSSSS